MGNEMIEYKDLSTPLKIAVVGAWISLCIWVVSFIFGFVTGLYGGN